MGCGASSPGAAGKYAPVPPDAAAADLMSPTKQLEDRQRPGRVTEAADEEEARDGAMDQQVQKLERENAILRRQVEAFVEERRQLAAAASATAPSAPDAAPPARGSARLRAPGALSSAPSETASMENRLAALEELSKQQHIVWVDKVRPSLAWIIDRMQEVHVRVGAEGGAAPPPRTPSFATPQRRQTIDASMVSGLSGTVRPSVIASAYGVDMDAERQAQVDIALRRLRDACQAYTAADWRPKLKRYAMPAGPRADDQIPLAEFTRAIRRALVDENTRTYEVGDCELVHQAVDYDKTGIVGLEEMAEFLEGPGMGEQNRAAAKIQSMQRGKRARRRVSAKMAKSLANVVRLDQGLGQSKDERWHQMANMHPARLLELVFNQIDNNRSGTITRRELRYSTFSSYFRDHWKAMNSNDDKSVDVTEWEEFWGDMFHQLGAEKYAETVVNMAWQGQLRLPDETGDGFAPKRTYNAPGVPGQLSPKKVSAAEQEEHHIPTTKAPKGKKKKGSKGKKKK